MCVCVCDLLQGTIASSLTCVQLHKRAEKIAGMLAERGHLQDGDHVALVYPPGKRTLQRISMNLDLSVLMFSMLLTSSLLEI